jgi:hypothetical protein
VTEKHLNAGGVCQGGALFTLADLAFAAVANSRGRLTLSLNAILILNGCGNGYRSGALAYRSLLQVSIGLRQIHYLTVM